MSDSESTKAFDTAVAIRNFEIGLFWQRSLFFWGFIGAAFVGHAALRQVQSNLSLVLACFGLICSVAWSLVNRGSKYWQESWESKVNRTEEGAVGTLFRVEEPPQDKGRWLSGRRYSVSKLAIALSDFVVLIWAGLVAWELLRICAPLTITPQFKRAAAIVLAVVSIGYCGLLAWLGRSTPRGSVKPNPSIERTASGEPETAAHVKR